MREQLVSYASKWADRPTGGALRRQQKTKRQVTELGRILSVLSTARRDDAEAVEENREALVALRGAIDRILAPGDTHATANRAAQRNERPRTGPVRSAFEQADELFDKGMEHWWEGDRTRACVLYRKALHLDPWHADAHNHLGIQCLDLGKVEEAERHFRQAIEGGEEHLEREGKRIPWGIMENRPYLRGLDNLALVLRQTGRYQEALDLHLRLMKLNPNDNQGVRWLIGEEYHRLGDLERAVAAYGRAPEEPGCRFGLALASLEAKRPGAEIGRALLGGFALNRYIAPMLLGERWQRLDGFHGTNTAEPEWASEHVRENRDLWQRVPESVHALRFWWKAEPVRRWCKQLDDNIVALKTIPVCAERSLLVDQDRILRSSPTINKLVRAVLKLQHER